MSAPCGAEERWRLRRGAGGWRSIALSAAVALGGCAFTGDVGNAHTGAREGDPLTDPDARADAAAPFDGNIDPACGARVPNYAYPRPYADSAPWNVPVCGLEAWSESEDYVSRLWDYGNNVNLAAPSDEGQRRFIMGFGLDSATDYAPTVFDAADATTVRKVSRRNGWPGSINLSADETLPWNPAWRASRGTDAVAIILDHETGKEWNLWGLVQPDQNGFYNDNQCWLNLGYSATTHLCTGSANLIRTPTGEVADYRTYGGNFPSRGVKIQFFAMLTQPAEVAAGEIRHALMMATNNTMFGPECTKEELGTPAAGHTCGFALAPAGGLEHGTCATCTNPELTADALRARTIPEGIRFALRISDADIEAWLDERGYTGRKRETARIFAVALRDYGWFITDTGGVADWVVSGAANPATEAAWGELGVNKDEDHYGKYLMLGLATRERIWAVEPATNDCADGSTSQYGCRAHATHY